MRSPPPSPILERVGHLVGLTVRQAVETIVLPYHLARDAAGLIRDRLASSESESASASASAAASEPEWESGPRPTSEPVRSRPRAAVPARPRSSPAAVVVDRSADPRARRRALEAIGGLEVGATEGAVIEALHDPDPEVRRAAASAAARARLSSAVFSLILTLDDPEREVREAARQAIELITEQEIVFDAGQPAEARRLAVEELKGWWKEVRFAQLAEEFGEEAP